MSVFERLHAIDRSIMNDIALAASVRKRAPTNEQIAHKYGEKYRHAVSRLAYMGCLRSEVYGKNFRVIELCDGPFSGNRTQEPQHGGKPYRVVP